MIDLNSLVNEPLPRDSQRAPSHQVNPDAVTPVELVQDLLRPFVEDLGRVREELGAERVRREQAERERDKLQARLEALQAPETDAKASEGAEPRSSTISPHTDTGEPEEAPYASETDAEDAEDAELAGVRKLSGGRTGGRAGRGDGEATVVAQVVRGMIDRDASVARSRGSRLPPGSLDVS